MNPFKANKVQLGFSDQSPSISSDNNALNLYDSSHGNIKLGQLAGTNFLDGVLNVGKNAVGSDYLTIQEAVDNISDGGCIFVHEGTYTENLTIANKNISIICFGRVRLQVIDSTAITITSSTVSISKLEIKVLNGAGVPKPFCIEATDADVGNSLTLHNCILDVSAHVNAGILSSDKVDVFLYSTKYNDLFNTSTINISNSNTVHILNTKTPILSLSNILSESYVSGHTQEINLVNSDLYLLGTNTSCTGDATSKLYTKSISGELSFNNVNTNDYLFSCPLPNADYTVVFQTLSSREIPVVTNKAITGFTISTQNNVTEDVKFIVFQNI